LGRVGGSRDVRAACGVAAGHRARVLLGVLDGARQVRLDPGAEAWRALVGMVGGRGDAGMDTTEGVAAVAAALRAVLESPEFGVAVRMPDVHVMALMLPLGLPVVLQFVSSVKFAVGKRKEQGKERPMARARG